MIHKWVEKGASITLGLKLYYASSSSWYVVELSWAPSWSNRWEKMQESPCDGIGRHASFRNSCLRRVGSSPTGGNDIIFQLGEVLAAHDGASCHASRLIDADGFSILHFLFLIKMAYLPDDSLF